MRNLILLFIAMLFGTACPREPSDVTCCIVEYVHISGATLKAKVAISGNISDIKNYLHVYHEDGAYWIGMPRGMDDRPIDSERYIHGATAIVSIEICK